MEYKSVITIVIEDSGREAKNEAQYREMVKETILDEHNIHVLDEEIVVQEVDISCPECLGNGYDLDGPQEDDEQEDCSVCCGTGTTTGEDWYGGVSI